MTAKPSSTKSGRLIGCVAIAGVVLIVIGGAIAAAILFIPGLSSQVSPASANLIVNLTLPLDDSTVPLNSSTAIQAEALGTQPITTLELWVDGALFASKTASQSGQKQFFASWGWTPASAGDHTLFVRAGDAAHHVVDSNPVVVTADADANSTIAVNYPVKPGDTAQSVANKFQTTPQQIIDLNPQLNPSNPITPGLTISNPIAPGLIISSPITPGLIISVPLPMPAIPATSITPTVPSAPPLPPPPPPPNPPAAGTPITVTLTTVHLTPSKPVDEVYCYLSLNNGPVERIPPAPNTFIAPTSGVFDLSSYFPSLFLDPGQTSVSVLLDCWGVKGGTVVYLGQAKQTLNASQKGPITLSGADFKLTADTGNPVAKKHPKGFRVSPDFIYPPTGVSYAGDPKVCSGHMNPIAAAFGGELLCAGAIADHKMVLVWDWPADKQTYQDAGNPLRIYKVIQNIDGYRVYENDYWFQHTLVKATNVGSLEKVAIFSPPPRPTYKTIIARALNKPLPPRCFVVRAYKGALESTDSNLVGCLDGGGAIPGTKTITLQPARFASPFHDHEIRHGAFASFAPAHDGPGEIGYYHDDTSDYTYQLAQRSLVLFDLSAVDGAVWKATLTYHLQNGTIGGGGLPAMNGNWSCASELMLPTEDWVNPKDFVPADTYLDIKLTDMVNNYFPTDFPTDVTSAVRNWKLNGSNFGFELRGRNEDTGAEDNWKCLSTYSDFQLQVEYFPK